MTVKELIDDIHHWMDEKLLKEDDEIFITPDSFSYDECELFRPSSHNMNHPILDKKNPTRRAFCLTALERVPNSTFGENKEYRWFGTGHDMIEVTADATEKDIETKIALSKAKLYKDWLEKKEKEKNDNGEDSV